MILYVSPNVSCIFVVTRFISWKYNKHLFIQRDSLDISAKQWKLMRLGILKLGQISRNRIPRIPNHKKHTQEAHFDKYANWQIALRPKWRVESDLDHVLDAKTVWRVVVVLHKFARLSSIPYIVARFSYLHRLFLYSIIYLIYLK